MSQFVIYIMSDLRFYADTNLLFFSLWSTFIIIFVQICAAHGVFGFLEIRFMIKVMIFLIGIDLFIWTLRLNLLIIAFFSSTLVIFANYLCPASAKNSMISSSIFFMNSLRFVISIFCFMIPIFVLIN